MSDAYWMQRALVLARMGLGTAFPNPMVGAIVLDAQGKPAGKGYHPKAGEPHAEVFALKEAGEKANGGTLYVTLEPCCHQGKTPPCVESIAKAKIKKVVVATKDPNALVNGRGIAWLQGQGIDVAVGCQQGKADRLNRVFFKYIRTKKMFVTAKVALSLDRKLGVRTERLQISDPMMERTTMKLRAGAHAVMVGIQTVLTDDPRLNVRGRWKKVQPVRVVLDTDLRIPVRAKLFEEKSPVWIFHGANHDGARAEELVRQHPHATLINCPTASSGRFDPAQVVATLEKRNIHSLLIEGGASVLQSFHERNLVDEWVVYLNDKKMAAHDLGEQAVGLSLTPPLRLIAQHATKRAHDIEFVGTPNNCA